MHYLQYIEPETLARITPYLEPFASSHTQAIGVAGALAGHTLSFVFGKEAAFVTAVAFTAFGANAWQTHPIQSSLLAGGLFIAPTVIKRVTTEVFSKIILNSMALGCNVGWNITKFSFHLLTDNIFSHAPEKALKTKIEKLRVKKIVLKNKIVDIEAKNQAQALLLQENALLIQELRTRVKLVEKECTPVGET